MMIRPYLKELPAQQRNLNPVKQFKSETSGLSLKKKSLKPAVGESNDMQQSRSRWDESRLSKSKEGGGSNNYHQDQYSSHKVLKSGKHIAMHLESQF